MTFLLTSYQIPTFPHPSIHFPSSTRLQAAKSQHNNKTTRTQHHDDGIPIDDVKLLAKFKSRHNFIRVLQVSRKADHPLAGSRLLLLDNPGNIHSIYNSLLLNNSSSSLPLSLTHTYFDVFAIFPPILPPGPLGLLGFGAGSAARLILQLYPHAVLHGWELDPSVLSVGREYFGLSKLEKDYPNRLFIYIGDAFKASVRDGFSGILVDLFSKGSLVLELQDPKTWEMLKRRLRKGGRAMVNVGGSCVEAEDKGRDGRVVMKETLKAMERVFGEDKVFVLRLGKKNRMGEYDDSSVAFTGDLPDLDAWKEKLPSSLMGYVDMWMPFRC